MYFSFSTKLLGVSRRRVRLTVYQFEPVATNSAQNVPAENLGGMTTLPPERSGARKPARRPWTWKSGMTKNERSAGVSS